MCYNLPPSVMDHYNLFPFAQAPLASLLMHACLSYLSFRALTLFSKNTTKTSSAQKRRRNTKMQKKICLQGWTYVSHLIWHYKRCSCKAVLALSERVTRRRERDYPQYYPKVSPSPPTQCFTSRAIATRTSLLHQYGWQWLNRADLSWALSSHILFNLCKTVMKNWFYTRKSVLCWASVHYWYALRQTQREGLKTETTPTYRQPQSVFLKNLRGMLLIILVIFCTAK